MQDVVRAKVKRSYRRRRNSDTIGEEDVCVGIPFQWTPPVCDCEVRDLDELKSLQIEVSLFRRNLKKDNITRRRDVQVLQCKSEKLKELRQKFIVAKNNFNSQVHVLDVLNKAKRIVSDIEVRLEEGESILSSRVARLGQTEAASDSAESSDSSDSVNSAGVNFKMTEKFDLKTAASLLPVMDGSERVTKQLIDGIEMYDSMLDDNGKKLLTTYILKTRLSENIRNYLLTKKSPASLSVQLSRAKQYSKSVEEFGRSIEELLVDLTITQADGNRQALEILRQSNEKIAINAFANGLGNFELRTVIKARNYEKLSDAIRGATDEETPKSETSCQIHRLHKQNYNWNYNRGNHTFRGTTNNFRGPTNNFRGTTRNFRGSTSNFRGSANNFRGHDRRYTRDNSNRNQSAFRMNASAEREVERENSEMLSMNAVNFVRVNYRGKELKFLLDTGATVSVIFQNSIAQDEVIDQTRKIKIHGIAGSTVSQGSVQLLLSFNNVEMQQEFLLMREFECGMNGVIGADFFIKHDAIINYEKNEFSFWSNDRKIFIPIESQCEFYTEIPSRCEIIKYCYVENNDDYVVLPDEICEGVYIAGSIVCARDNLIPVKILNVRDVCSMTHRPSYTVFTKRNAWKRKLRWIRERPRLRNIEKEMGLIGSHLRERSRVNECIQVAPRSYSVHNRYSSSF
ncbi:hypothetical protein Zmor_002052 [Zophobas morio]|uniref:Peptidase A2 domain-containing protein n=1 Tax=Zophobas morio TaxID=2755281 RepID=A0AA38IZU7_9CUCU|nr:hypothetical protein Zmor_002052 [Zophobas morio]